MKYRIIIIFNSGQWVQKRISLKRVMGFLNTADNERYIINRMAIFRGDDFRPLLFY
jgi:hypothetical protein